MSTASATAEQCTRLLGGRLQGVVQEVREVKLEGWG